jgi:hypothetical protein
MATRTNQKNIVDSDESEDDYDCCHLCSSSFLNDNSGSNCVQSAANPPAMIATNTDMMYTWRRVASVPTRCTCVKRDLIKHVLNQNYLDYRSWGGTAGERV